MLLNLLRVEGVEPEELMRRSYRQFQTERSLPTLHRKLKLLQVHILTGLDFGIASAEQVLSFSDSVW